jgi:DNA (cytosine-5)-methyltransferase 1
VKELSLFSGAGGGVLGTNLLGWETIGYVEYNEYCQRIIGQRIKDGYLDEAPIFSDVNAFISEGYADAYKGMVGVVSAGFPCQPFSVAGKREAKDDPRNCWPQTIDIIRRVRPHYCLLENVGGLLSRKHRYFETILKDLAESGYDARWKVISAAEVGAPHKRDRLWVVAFNSNNLGMGWEERTSQGIQSIFEEPEGQESEHVCEGVPKTGDVANSNPGHSRQEEEVRSRRYASKPGSQDVPDTGSERLEGWEPPIGEEEAYPTAGSTCWWDTEPGVGRVANGMAHRMDRLKALGNGQVPAVVETAFELLSSHYRP